ncbi:MAG: SEL1-like repeat protein, partial [Planctomycetaceae bacterium]|nr:SEL1-like repeat protein [Planctomycetaceae bacterium]
MKRWVAAATLITICWVRLIHGDDTASPAVGSSGAGVRPGLQLFDPIAQEPPAGNAGMFVGVCRFDNDPGLPSLVYATHDAIELAHLFVFELKLIPAANCHLLLSGDAVSDPVTQHFEQLKRAGAKIGRPDRSRILLTMRELKTAATAPEHMLVCSFSSHGFDDRSDPYVMPSDGFRDLLSQTAVPLKTIETMIQDSKAGHRLLLVDACQERISAKSIESQEVGSAVTEAFVEALKSPTGQAKFASCSPGEFSFEHGSLGGVGHGVFTYHVLEALRGGATADGDNIVRLGDVADYVAMSVADWAETNKRPRQTPFLESPIKTRQLPLATKADDVRQLIALLESKSFPKEFDAALRGSLKQKLERLDPTQPSDRELLAFTRDFLGGRLSTRVFVPYVRSSIRGAAVQDPDYVRGLELHAGSAGTQDRLAAYQHFRRAANRGHVLAMTFVGDQHQHGTGIPKNREEAENWYRKAMPGLRQLAEDGDPIAQLQYGWAYESGLAVERDAAAATEWYRRAAEAGDALGQWQYAQSLRYGRGVAVDMPEAVRWYQRAAAQNTVKAFESLHNCFRYGDGVEADEITALGWLRRALDADSVWAKKEMAYLYDSGGLGVKQDRQAARRLFKSAADQQDAHAMARYGRYLALGYGGDEDDEEALEWFQKSAFLGDWMGMAWLGIQYSEGEGVPADGATAVRWYREATEQPDGNAWVLTSLGVLYAKEELVANNDAEAFRWFQQAADRG